MSYTFTAQEMQGLSEQQKVFIIETVIVGVFADGAADDSEVARFDAEFRKQPWGLPDATMVELIKKSVARISAFKGPDDATNMLKGASAALTDPTIREKTFALLATVMYADKKMNKMEMNVLTAFAAAFEIPEERLRVIGEAVKKGG